MLQKILVTVFIPMFSFQSWAVSEIKEAYPNPCLNPSDVVRVQLNAMQQNGPSNFGIEVTFRFASPSNKRFTGPLKRFIQLVKNPSYKHLLNHIDLFYDISSYIVMLDEQTSKAYLLLPKLKFFLG